MPPPRTSLQRPFDYCGCLLLLLLLLLLLRDVLGAGARRQRRLRRRLQQRGGGGDGGDGDVEGTCNSCEWETAGPALAAVVAAAAVDVAVAAAADVGVLGLSGGASGLLPAGEKTATAEGATGSDWAARYSSS
jgi:hypothetical protein